MVDMIVLRFLHDRVFFGESFFFDKSSVIFSIRRNLLFPRKIHHGQKGLNSLKDRENRSYYLKTILPKTKSDSRKMPNTSFETENLFFKIPTSNQYASIFFTSFRCARF